MRKSFFKKLSLGMALALVLGTTAHAGVAQAAAATWTLKKNSATVYLNEDNVKGTPDNYDFNFKNKPANWKKDYSFNWYSENEEVATVAKGGVVTGVSVGEATIVCEVVNKKTYEVESVKAKVTVKANAAAVEISNAAKYDAEAGVTVKTGEVIDLNRTMYDENGNKTTKRGVYVTDYTRWYVLDENGQTVDKEVATVNQKNGQFVINKAGIYGLVCETYQSAKNPQAIVNDFVMVVVEDAKPAVDALQTTVRDFTLELSQPISKSILDNGKNEEAFMDKIDVVLELEADESDRYVLPIKNIEAIKEFTTEDGMVSKINVTMWDIFEDGKVYTVGVKEYKSITDAEENKDMANVVYMATDKFTACVSTPDEVNVYIKNPTVSGTNAKILDEVYVTDRIDHQDFYFEFIDYGTEGNIDVTELYFDNAKKVLLTDGDLVGEIKAVSGKEDDLYYVDVDMNELEISAFEGGEGKKYQFVATYYEYTKKGEVVTVASTPTDFTVLAEPKKNPLYTDSAVINVFGSAPAYRNSWETRTMKKIIAVGDEDLYVAASIYDDWYNKYSNAQGNVRFYSSNTQVADVDLYDGKFTSYEVGSVRISIYVIDEATGEERFADAVTVRVLKERTPETIQVNGKHMLTKEIYSHIVVGTKWDDLASDVMNGEYIYSNNMVTIGNEWLLDVSNGDRTDNITTPMDEEYAVYYVKVLDNHGEEMTKLGYDDFVFGDGTEDYFTMSTDVAHVWDAAGNTLGYPVYVYNADADVVEAISNNENYKRSAVTLHGVIGLELNQKSTVKLSATLRKPIDEVVEGYQMSTTSAAFGMGSEDFTTTVKVLGTCKNDVPVWNFENFVYSENDIKTLVNRLNATNVTLTAKEADIKAEATTGTALVYTITKSGKLVKALGTGTAKTTASGSSIVTSIINGETMDATADRFITFNNVTPVEVGTEVLDVTFSNANGDYVLTLYEITTKNGTTTYKQTKATTCTMSANAGKSALKATPVAIESEVVSRFSDVLMNKLTWTADADVRAVVQECFNIQIAGRTDGRVWANNGWLYVEDAPVTSTDNYDGLNMLFNVRINKNTMYVKAIKVFVPAGDDFVELEAEVGWTITLAE